MWVEGGQGELPGGIASKQRVVNQGCQTAALKCSCSYILRFCGVNNMTILSGAREMERERETANSSQIKRESGSGAAAGMCHLTAAQMNCNYLEHAFRHWRHAPKVMGCSSLRQMSVTNFAVNKMASLVIYVCVYVCVREGVRVRALLHFVT